jgi:hypothetical protein
VESWYYSWVSTSDVQLFDFVMTDCFGLFYISESKNHGFVLEKQIKIRELPVWVIQKHGSTSSFHETTGTEPTVRKAFFFEFQNF